MPSNPGPVRIARARFSDPQNQTETMEIDFNLARNEGVELFAAEFGMQTHVLAGGNPAASSTTTLSLHVETGALEGGLTSFPSDTYILNSEILAEANWWGTNYDNATQASYSIGGWTTEHAWNFVELLGNPLILAQNITFRAIASTSAVTVGAFVTLFHRYVDLSDAELGRLTAGFR